MDLRPSDSCVCNIAWIMDSLERLVRRNVFEVSGLFNSPGDRATVYTRTEALSGSGRLVRFAYNCNGVGGDSVNTSPSS